MRNLIHAAFLAGLLLPVAGAASAADLDYNYEPGPPPPPVVVLPPRPFCGFYRPCFRRPLRFGFYGPPPYGRPEGYGYDYDRERYERSERHATRYGYEHPREHYGERRREYRPRERYDRYGERRPPYADPLGHDRRGGYDRDDRGPGPDERGGPEPYRRG